MPSAASPRFSLKRCPTLSRLFIRLFYSHKTKSSLRLSRGAAYLAEGLLHSRTTCSRARIGKALQVHAIRRQVPTQTMLECNKGVRQSWNVMTMLDNPLLITADDKYQVHANLMQLAQGARYPPSSRTLPNVQPTQNGYTAGSAREILHQTCPHGRTTRRKKRIFSNYLLNSLCKSACQLD